MKLVSVIIPLYNAENSIKDTIDSATSQSWPEKEIIIVDDGSTDNSFEIAKKYESAFVKVVSLKNNGAAAARNFGIKHSTGHYIQFLDADDLLSYDKISSQMKLASLNTYDPNYVYTCKTVRFTNKSEVNGNEKSDNPLVNKDYPNSKELLVDLLFNNTYCANSSYLVSRSLIEKSGHWNETLSTNDDAEFFARILIHASSVKYCDQGIAFYRDSPISLSKKRNKNNIISQFQSLKLISQNLMQKYNTPQSYAALNRALNWFIVEWFPDNKFLLREVEKFMKKANLKFQTSSGNPVFRFMVGTLGWSNAMLFSDLLGRLKRNRLFLLG